MRGVRDGWGGVSRERGCERCGWCERVVRDEGGVKGGGVEGCVRGVRGVKWGGVSDWGGGV